MGTRTKGRGWMTCARDTGHIRGPTEIFTWGGGARVNAMGWECSMRCTDTPCMMCTNEVKTTAIAAFIPLKMIACQAARCSYKCLHKVRPLNTQTSSGSCAGIRFFISFFHFVRVICILLMKFLRSALVEKASLIITSSSENGPDLSHRFGWGPCPETVSLVVRTYRCVARAGEAVRFFDRLCANGRVSQMALLLATIRQVPPHHRAAVIDACEHIASGLFWHNDNVLHALRKHLIHDEL
eukprot:m.631809 g.631809  ORF g.631809 m.631809 type:complete len:240 (+) comp22573_c0_seq49:1558-2277(+)